jgi:hypothetical protein
MYSSHVPPPDQWEEIANGHEATFRCTHAGLPWRLFCGRPATVATKYGPRCQEHLEPDYEQQPS